MRGVYADAAFIFADGKALRGRRIRRGVVDGDAMARFSRLIVGEGLCVQLCAAYVVRRVLVNNVQNTQLMDP